MQFERIIRRVCCKRLPDQSRSVKHGSVPRGGRAGLAKRKSCGRRARNTPWLCGSPASIRSRQLAAGKVQDASPQLFAGVGGEPPP